MANDKLILLTGATGYVGGRLLKVLEEQGARVRCLARRPQYLQARVSAGTEVVGGDVLDSASLLEAMSGVHTAYYLVHSMDASGDFEKLDRQAATNFQEAAEKSGLKRIIYLGGLVPNHSDLSPHLRSRQEVGQILRDGRVPAIELRASIVIGSGSLSFEMIRALVERLPFMIMPRWVSVRAQPIAISDLLGYLVACLSLPETGSRIFEIGGADQMSYGELMREYASQRGLRRLMVRVPVLTPRLSSLWLGLVTPVYARIGRKLIDSIRHSTVVEDDSSRRVFAIQPKTARESIAAALSNDDREFAETRWSDALSVGGSSSSWGGSRVGNRLVDSRTEKVPVDPETAFRPIRRIGGTNGWYYANWLWHVRGLVDLLVGGVGLRRGRRDPETVRPGDVIDWWRVEDFEEPKRLRLLAEMKVPGRAWLEFEVEGHPKGSIIRQTAIFDPYGLWGQLYWYLIYPLHALVFRGMIRGVARAAQPGEGGDLSRASHPSS